MKRFTELLMTVITFMSDEDLIGLWLEEMTQMIIKPLVFVYVCGTYAVEYKNKFVGLIEPKTPDFSLNGGLN